MGFLLVNVMVASVQGEKKKMKKGKKKRTIARYVCKSRKFKTLCAALNAAGLYDVLDDPEAEFTLFAPTDKAFGNLPEGTVEALLDDIPALSNILLFHVTGGAVYSKSLEDGGLIWLMVAQASPIGLNIIR